MNPINKLLYKALVRSFAVPLIFSLFLATRLLFPNWEIWEHFSLGAQIGIVIGSFLGLFLSRAKYLYNISFDGQAVKVAYHSKFGEPFVRVFELASIKKVECRMKHPLLRFLTRIDIIVENGKVSFMLVDKRLLEKVESLQEFVRRNEI